MSVFGYLKIIRRYKKVIALRLNNNVQTARYIHKVTYIDPLEFLFIWVHTQLKSITMSYEVSLIVVALLASYCSLIFVCFRWNFS